MTKLHVGYIQLNPRFGCIKENTTRALKLGEQSNADLLVLPELFTTGYSFADSKEIGRFAEEIPHGPTTNRLIEFCINTNTFLVAGIAERSGDKIYNSALFLGPDGYIGTYRKIHLFDREKLLFTQGNLGFPVFEALGTKLGIMICFDWVFPEAARTLSLKGARILCHPANLILPYCPKAMPVRSLENRVFSITANRTGSENRINNNLTFIGNSQVVSPNGDILNSASPQDEEIGVVEIDTALAESKIIGPSNDLFADRMPSAYCLS